MHRLYSVPDDFEASIKIFSFEEGGRQSPPFNGIRWDLCYTEDSATEHLWMIWPDFMDEHGDSLPTDKPLPIGVNLTARMTILVDEMRAEVHRKRLAIGSTFYCHEGGKRVASGRVTKITGLFNERPAA
jgi:translation elongation factor EF-Tu-like GTPase